jgi:hypothetical protein
MYLAVSSPACAVYFLFAWGYNHIWKIGLSEQRWDQAINFISPL